MKMSYHARERAQERGITLAMISEAIATKPMRHNKDAWKNVYHGPKKATGKHVFVIMDGDKVITAYWLG